MLATIMDEKCSLPVFPLVFLSFVVVCRLLKTKDTVNTWLLFGIGSKAVSFTEVICDTARKPAAFTTALGRDKVA